MTDRTFGYAKPTMVRRSARITYVIARVAGLVYISEYLEKSLEKLTIGLTLPLPATSLVAWTVKNINQTTAEIALPE